MIRFLAICAAAALVSAPAAGAVTFDCRACETGTRFYEARDSALAWTGPANAALFDELVEAVSTARSHGLNPNDYHLAQLQAVDPTQPDLEADTLATDAYLTLAAHLLSGRLDPVSIEPDWSAARRGRDLAVYLQGALASGAVIESLEALAPPPARL